MEENNASGTNTNTILIVVILLILVGFGVWWFAMRGGENVQEDATEDTSGLNVEINVPDGSGEDDEVPQ